MLSQSHCTICFNINERQSAKFRFLKKRLNFTCMLSHTNDSLMGLLRCSRYPKEILFVRCQTSRKIVAQLPLYLKGSVMLQTY